MIDSLYTTFDCIVSDDIYFTSYGEHHKTRPLKMISWYSGWLACGSRLMCPHLLSKHCGSSSICMVYSGTSELLFLPLSFGEIWI